MRVARAKETINNRRMLDGNESEESEWLQKKSVALSAPSSQEYYEGEKLLLDRITLSPSIIDPSLTEEQIKAMSQKD